MNESRVAEVVSLLDCSAEAAWAALAWSGGEVSSAVELFFSLCSAAWVDVPPIPLDDDDDDSREPSAEWVDVEPIPVDDDDDSSEPRLKKARSAASEEHVDACCRRT